MRYVLIDRFLELEKGEHAVAIKCITRGEPFMAKRRFYPTTLVLEAMFQAAGALIRSASGFKRMSALGKVDFAEFPGRARPGDTIRIEVRSILSRPEGKLCSAEATVDGVAIGRTEFMILYVPPDLEPPMTPERALQEYQRRRALRIPVELEES